MNIIEYLRHSLHEPRSYHRRFDFDLPEDMSAIAKRVSLASLPFISLYRPVGFVLSIGMNGTRACSHFQNVIASDGKIDWSKTAIETSRAGLALLSVTVTIFSFTAGSLVTTACDGVQSGSNTMYALWEGEYSTAVEESLHTLASVVYLTFMVTGTLEAMLAFAIIQAALSLYQGKREMNPSFFT